MEMDELSSSVTHSHSLSIFVCIILFGVIKKSIVIASGEKGWHNNITTKKNSTRISGFSHERFSEFYGFIYFYIVLTSRIVNVSIAIRHERMVRVERTRKEEK